MLQYGQLDIIECDCAIKRTQKTIRMRNESQDMSWILYTTSKKNHDLF